MIARKSVRALHDKSRNSIGTENDKSISNVDSYLDKLHKA